MKQGDLVRIYFDGRGSSGEEWIGVVLNAFTDHLAKKRRDNNSRWISGSILLDGTPTAMNLYWDDEYEVLDEAG